MLIGNDNIHIQINVSELIKKNCFISVLWIKSCNELKRMLKFYFRTFIFSNSQIEILVSFSRSTNISVNISFPNSNFEGNFSTYVFGKSFCHYRDLKSECWTYGQIRQKNIKFFICVEIRILCKSVICMKLTFSRGHYNKHADWKRLLCV